MKNIRLLMTVCILATSLLASSRTVAVELVLDNTPAKLYFSPDGGCTKAIVREIETASREILVQAFSFTSAPIRNALIIARKRGVNVEVILDKGEQTEQGFRTTINLAKNGISAYIDDQHSNAHNKLIIIDRETAITGSFNFTYAAESKNAENVLIVKSKGLAAAYADNWLSHRQHSKKF